MEWWCLLGHPHAKLSERRHQKEHRNRCGDVFRRHLASRGGRSNLPSCEIPSTRIEPLRRLGYRTGRISQDLNLSCHPHVGLELQVYAVSHEQLLGSQRPEGLRIRGRTQAVEKRVRTIEEPVPIPKVRVKA